MPKARIAYMFSSTFRPVTYEARGFCASGWAREWRVPWTMRSSPSLGLQKGALEDIYIYILYRLVSGEGLPKMKMVLVAPLLHHFVDRFFGFPIAGCDRLHPGTITYSIRLKPMSLSPFEGFSKLRTPTFSPFQPKTRRVPILRSMVVLDPHVSFPDTYPQKIRGAADSQKFHGLMVP